MENNFFEWSQVYETGISKIDEQHKVIVSTLNKLYNFFLEDGEHIELDEIITELVEYADYHFKEEERLFEQYGYTEAKEHKKEHDEFIHKINSIIKKRKDKDDSVTIELINFLKDWLTNHIMITDQEYATYLKKNNITV